MTQTGLPPWPAEPIAYGPVALRQLYDRDVPMVRELSTDPYVPLIGSLPANAAWLGGLRLRRLLRVGVQMERMAPPSMEIIAPVM